MRKLYILFLLSLVFVLAKGNDLQVLNGANAAYKKGQFEVALKGYQQLLDSGYSSPDIYYNLGNANYRLDNIAAAILNYEKAHKLAPGDEDVEMNLRLANTRLTDKIEGVPEFFLKRWWISFITIFSIQVWSVLIVLFFLSGFALLIVYLFSRELILKRTSFYAGLVLVILALASMGIASAQDNYFRQHKDAIVFNGVVNVKSAPNDKQKTLYIIHEGTKVTVLEDNDNWLKVELPNGSVGWITAAAVKSI
ncbi:MAG: SH3 domain-containing protein [Bacteroidota bacterium]